LIDLPWDASIMVPIEQAGLIFGGRIDRVDIRAAGDAARITDYKSGQPPDKAKRITLAQGRELQRVLYAMAVRTLLPEVKVILARLVYLADDAAIFVLRDEELDQAIADATMYLAAAVEILRSGRIAPRSEQDANYDDMRLALPADREVYLR
jgi:RecB family exonuclease